MNEGHTQTKKGDGWLSDRVWLLLAGLITALSALLRFWDLALKPLHHDEGVNGFFLTNLVRDGVYKYDPANYHGPTLYYLTLPFVEAFGLKTIPVRASVAIWGVLMVVLVFYLRDYLGRIGTLLAGLFVALAPGMVYISRYFIHEIFFVFLSLGIVVSVVFFIEKKQAGPGAIAWMTAILYACFMPSVVNLSGVLNETFGGGNTALWTLRAVLFIVASVIVFFVMRTLVSWEQGQPIYLLLASASVSLMFATKETTFITLGTMVIAFGVIYGWRPIIKSEAVRKNWIWIVISVHAVLLLAAAYYREAFFNAWRWLKDTFLSTGGVHEPWMFFGMSFLVLTAGLSWVLFLIDLRKVASEGPYDEPVELTWSAFRRSLARNGGTAAMAAGAAIIFIYLGVLFFSSFFTYGEGVQKAFEAYSIWTKTGSKDHTQNGPLAYIKWGLKVESPLLILGGLGSVLSLLWARHRLAMFVALWGIGLFLAYVLIPYKTPWLALSFILPMCLSAGYALGQMIEGRNIDLKVAGTFLAVIASLMLAWETYDLSFVRYDDEEMSYVYAHTKRGVNDLLERIEHYAEKSGKGHDATIEFVSPDYWPLTWYLNDYKHADFYGTLIDTNSSEMIVAKKDAQDGDIIKRYANHYKYIGVYPLRPGVNLVLLVRRDLADSDAQDVYKVMEYEAVPGYTN